MSRLGYSSRFADSQPLSTLPKRVEQDEIARQTEAFLAAGGRITELPASTFSPYRDRITGYTPEQQAAAGKRGAAKTHGYGDASPTSIEKSRRRGGKAGGAVARAKAHIDPKPFREQVNPW